MQTNYNSIFNIKNFNKIYSKTKFPNVFYLKLKSPLAIQYELTSGCNQKCVFCYNVWKEGCVFSKKKTLSKKIQFRIIKKIIETEVFDIIFSGGEPLLVNWLDELIQMASDKNIRTTIITNGVLLTKDKATKLKKAGLKSMQISLHHYDSEINDTLTNKKGSFEVVI